MSVKMYNVSNSNFYGLLLMRGLFVGLGFSNLREFFIYIYKDIEEERDGGSINVYSHRELGSVQTQKSAVRNAKRAALLSKMVCQKNKFRFY